MTYLVAAYVVFWIITFSLVFSIFTRQHVVEQDLATLKTMIEEQNKDAHK